MSEQSRYRIHPIIDEETQCHNWPGSKNQDGYGLVNRDGRTMMAHRWYWIQANGPIDDGLQLDHTCRNRACCNPEHLEPVTNRENALRSLAPTVLLHHQNRCIRGHELTKENSILKTSGARQCRECQREANRRSYRRRREAVNV